MKLLKTKYKSLLSGETLIPPEKLLTNEKNVFEKNWSVLMKN